MGLIYRFDDWFSPTIQGRLNFGSAGAATVWVLILQEEPTPFSAHTGETGKFWGTIKNIFMEVKGEGKKKEGWRKWFESKHQNELTFCCLDECKRIETSYEKRKRINKIK